MQRSLRWSAVVIAAGLSVSSAGAANEEAIKAAIDRGTAALKQVRPEGGGGRGNQIGATALVALTLLECGVPAKDPTVRQAADVIRQTSLDLTHTYSLALAIMFLDRLGEGDVPLIQSMAVRLMAGQNATGGWSYHCPRSTDLDSDRMRTYLKERESIGSREAAPRKEKPPLPKDLKAVIDALDRGAVPAMNGGRAGHGAGDNSNTQFAILGLWVARRHGAPTDRALAKSEMRFRNSQHGDGGWGYVPIAHSMRGLGSTPSMTCAGLLGLALGYGVGNEAILRTNPKGPGKKPAPRVPAKDPQVRAALAVLGGCIGRPTNQVPGRPGKAQGPVIQKGYYYLFSLERVAVAYNLKTIGNKDWYGWGSEILLNSQGTDGLWQGEHGAAVDSCFALLFLRRVNLVKDLTATLKGVEDPGEVTLKAGGVGGEGLVGPGLASGITLGDRPARGGEMRHAESEAARLGLDLLQAAPQKQGDMLDQLKDGKGAAYTDALAGAISQLAGPARTKAREALAERLARMTPQTLRAKMKEDDPEIRRAAALACAMKDDKQYVPDLIVLLDDRSPIVPRAAHAALKGLTAQDFGPPADATSAQRRHAVADWNSWWKKQAK